MRSQLLNETGAIVKTDLISLLPVLLHLDCPAFHYAEPDPAVSLPPVERFEGIVETDTAVLCSHTQIYRAARLPA